MFKEALKTIVQLPGKKSGNMWDNLVDTRASEGGDKGAAGTRTEIPLQTIVQGGADHLQPVQSDVFPFLVHQEVKKKKSKATQELYQGHNFPVGCEH